MDNGQYYNNETTMPDDLLNAFHVPGAMQVFYVSFGVQVPRPQQQAGVTNFTPLQMRH